MNKLKETCGTVLLNGAFLVRQGAEKNKTTFAGVVTSQPLTNKNKYAEDEIWLCQLMIFEPKRFTLKGSRYEGWLTSDIMEHKDFNVKELKEVTNG